MMTMKISMMKMEMREIKRRNQRKERKVVNKSDQMESHKTASNND
jgi:hypothetical protein